MKKLDEKTWLKIKTDYQLGMGIRELERKYDVPNTTIASKKKTEGWTQEPCTKFLELQSATQSFVQSLENPDINIVQTKISDLFTTQLEALGMVRHNAIESLKMHSHIIKKTKEKLNNEEYMPHQAALTLKTIGMDHEGALKSLGIQDMSKDEKGDDKVINIILEKAE